MLASGLKISACHVLTCWHVHAAKCSSTSKLRQQPSIHSLHQQQQLLLRLTESNREARLGSP